MILLVLLLCFEIVVANKVNDISSVEIRAVLINCVPNERPSVSMDTEATRFEREELFKHAALRDCRKKIALTLKMVSIPHVITEDEYIPIEHVYQLSKRVRLMNPYVLRLRREPPLQAYKLRKINTVIGTLEPPNRNRVEQLHRYRKSVSPSVQKKHQDITTVGHFVDNITRHFQASKHCDSLKRPNTNKCLSKRSKREEHHDVIDAISDKLSELTQDQRTRVVQVGAPNNQDNYRLRKKDAELVSYNAKFNNKLHPSVDNLNPWSTSQGLSSKSPFSKSEEGSASSGDYANSVKNDEGDKYFSMYEIEKPDVWYNIHIKMFEKLSTPDGKTVWRDIMKGQPASVSSLSLEWKNQDLNVRFKNSDYIQKDDYIISPDSMCLLVRETGHFNSEDDVDRYIIIPKEDIINVRRENNYGKREMNYTIDTTESTDSDLHPRVMIRTTRAFHEKKLRIDHCGGFDLLTIPHSSSHSSQVDLEARADDNELVTVGSSGRIMTVVSDNTRSARLVLNVQVSNTGLAAARFRARTLECGPGSKEMYDEKTLDSFNEVPILLAPRHTENIRFDIANEIPSDVAHCSVALVSDEGENIAVRDITIKKGDRCFCVWHCECVCLSDDPTLLCREMSAGQQVAAGLSLRERVRRARSICYHDNLTVNVLVTVLGVLLALLFFGLIKAVLGLIFRCIGSWGLTRIVHMPRKLPHYHEFCLKKFTVVYDDEGWPVHPQTRQRTVRIMSRSIEFVLNLVYFIIAPCLIIYDLSKTISGCVNVKHTATNSSTKPYGKKDSKCLSARDIQATHRRRIRRRRLTRWMTTEAENLSTNLWKTGLQMEPLLPDELNPNQVPSQPPTERNLDSDVDDTDFVLKQMQNSKETLARNRKINESDQTPENFYK